MRGVAGVGNGSTIIACVCNVFDRGNVQESDFFIRSIVVTFRSVCACVYAGGAISTRLSSFTSCSPDDDDGGASPFPSFLPSDILWAFSLHVCVAAVCVQRRPHRALNLLSPLRPVAASPMHKS